MCVQLIIYVILAKVMGIFFWVFLGCVCHLITECCIKEQSVVTPCEHYLITFIGEMNIFVIHLLI